MSVMFKALVVTMPFCGVFAMKETAPVSPPSPGEMRAARRAARNREPGRHQPVTNALAYKLEASMANDDVRPNRRFAGRRGAISWGGGELSFLKQFQAVGQRKREQTLQAIQEEQDESPNTSEAQTNHSPQRISKENLIPKSIVYTLKEGVTIRTLKVGPVVTPARRKFREMEVVEFIHNVANHAADEGIFAKEFDYWCAPLTLNKGDEIQIIEGFIKELWRTSASDGNLDSKTNFRKCYFFAKRDDPSMWVLPLDGEFISPEFLQNISLSVNKN